MNNLWDSSIDGDHLDNKNEENNASVDDQGEDRDTDTFIQYQGLPAYQQPERILTEPSSRPRGILVVPPAASVDP